VLCLSSPIEVHAQTPLFSDSFDRTTGLGTSWRVWFGPP
jgi:hypothetical protein